MKASQRPKRRLLKAARKRRARQIKYNSRTFGLVKILTDRYRTLVSLVLGILSIYTLNLYGFLRSIGRENLVLLDSSFFFSESALFTVFVAAFGLGIRISFLLLEISEQLVQELVNRSADRKKLAILKILGGLSGAPILLFALYFYLGILSSIFFLIVLGLLTVGLSAFSVVLDHTIHERSEASFTSNLKEIVSDPLGFCQRSQYAAPTMLIIALMLSLNLGSMRFQALDRGTPLTVSVDDGELHGRIVAKTSSGVMLTTSQRPFARLWTYRPEITFVPFSAITSIQFNP